MSPCVAHEVYLPSTRACRLLDYNPKDEAVLRVDGDRPRFLVALQVEDGTATLPCCVLKGAEAEKFLGVTAAEAAADPAKLQGEGWGRQQQQAGGGAGGSSSSAGSVTSVRTMTCVCLNPCAAALDVLRVLRDGADQGERQFLWLNLAIRSQKASRLASCRLQSLPSSSSESLRAPAAVCRRS